MKKKIIAVFMAVVLSVSCLSVNVFAIDFDGSVKTQEELNKAWLEAFEDFLKDPVNKSDDMIKANHAFTVGFAGNYGNGVVNGIMDTSDFLDSVVTDIVDNGRISDDSLSKFRDIFSAAGYQLDNEGFEKWYQDTYGKNYRPKAMINGKEGDYYIKTESADGNYKYIYILKYSGAPLTVYKNNAGVQYFSGQDMGLFSYRCYTKIKYSTGEWGDWVAGNWYDNSSTTSFFALSNTVAVHSYDRINTTTNLPLNYWGDIIGGDPITDWDSLGDDFAEGEGEGLTADELGDLTDDLLQALLDNMPDLTTTNGILQAIYRKCCEISNKIGKQATNVYKQTLQGIQTSLDKVNAFCSEFWGKFTDTMQSLFVPADDYLLDSLEDIQDEFSLKFAFADSLKKILTKCFDVYKSGGTKAPTVTFHITGLGFLNAIISHTIDLSDWDEYVKPIRSMVCVITYATFAWNTYRRIPAYVSGVGEQ